MSKIKIMCTSTGCIEYAPERYRNLGIDIIRVHVLFEGKEYLEGLDSTMEIDEKLRSAYNDVFLLYYNWKKYEDAGKYSEKMAQILKKYPNDDKAQRRLAGVYNDWAVVCMALGQTEAQREKLFLAEHMLKMQFGNDGELLAKLTLSTVYKNLAVSYSKDGDYSAAKEYYLRSFKSEIEAQSYGALSKRLEEQREMYEKAIPFFKKHAPDSLEEVVVAYNEVCERMYKSRNEELEYSGFITSEYLKCIDLMITALTEIKSYDLAQRLCEERLIISRDELAKEGLRSIDYLKDSLRIASEVYLAGGDENNAAKYKQELSDLSVQ